MVTSNGGDFQRLNEAYQGRPLVPQPPDPTREGRDRITPNRIRRVLSDVDLRDRDVLEFGTGRGSLATGIVELTDARHVTAVDVKSYPEWSGHQDPRLDFQVGDIAKDDVLEAASFDVVVSYVVFEHVRHPIQTLAALYRALRPNGVAWLYFNLHRGRKASHRYRQVYFPWPHLLFTEDEARQFLAEGSKTSRTTFAWVNRLTAAEYLQAASELGFSIRRLARNATPVEQDLEFYLQYEGVLGRYPALDLETDFMTMVLVKRAAAEPPPALGYFNRQVALDEAIARHGSP
jgi:SAM-dependent methyltransferase